MATHVEELNYHNTVGNTRRIHVVINSKGEQGVNEAPEKSCAGSKSSAAEAVGLRCTTDSPPGMQTVWSIHLDWCKTMAREELKWQNIDADDNAGVLPRRPLPRRKPKRRPCHRPRTHPGGEGLERRT
jgi:hypothetical protein